MTVLRRLNVSTTWFSLCFSLIFSKKKHDKFKQIDGFLWVRVLAYVQITTLVADFSQRFFPTSILQSALAIHLFVLEKSVGLVHFMILAIWRFKFFIHRRPWLVGASLGLAPISRGGTFFSSRKVFHSFICSTEGVFSPFSHKEGFFFIIFTQMKLFNSDWRM